MAAVTVAWDAAAFGRLDGAEATTNWAATGSGASPTVETDYYYQGTACISIQVKTSVYTLTYTDPTGIDMNTTPRVWMCKIIQTNKNAIDGNGLLLQIGNSTAYYEYDVFNSNTYPTLGGFVIVPIAPTVGGSWANNTVGTPPINSVTHFQGITDAAFTAKAPNFGIDAIDVVNLGEGLTLTRGDSTDANGTFSSFVTSDEGTVNNRWGHVQTRDGIIYVNGVLTVGNSTVNTEFTDQNRVLVFPDSRTSNGFNGLDWDLSNNTFVDISACVFNGRGSLAFTGVDTRPDYTATGTAGTLTISDSTFNTFREFTLTSNCVLDGCSFLSGQSIQQASGNVYQCTITEAATAPSEAFIVSDNVSRVVLCNFTQGANGGHAVEGNTAGTYTWNNTATGYGANGSSNAVFRNTSGGLITLNLSAGATNPTVTDSGAGSTTNVVSSATITLTNMYTESEVAIVDRTLNQTIASTENVNGAVISASVVAGGSGYSNSDTLTITGGTGTSATLNIVTNGTGNVISASVATAGNYTVDPPNPASHTGGSGTGATFSLDIRGSFEYTYGGSPVYDIVVFHLDYKDVRFSNFSFPASDSSLFISQTIDRVYNNP